MISPCAPLLIFPVIYLLLFRRYTNVSRFSRISCISGGKRKSARLNLASRARRRHKRIERNAEKQRKGDTGMVIRAQERNASALGHIPVTEGATPLIEACQPRDAQSRLALLRRKPEIVSRSAVLAGKSMFSRSVSIFSTPSSCYLGKFDWSIRAQRGRWRFWSLRGEFVFT